MDDSLKNRNQSGGESSGEIFSEGQSSYASAASVPEAEISPPYSQSEQSPETVSSGPPVEDVPPPYNEDNRKKFLILAIILTFFFLLIVLLLKIVLSGKKPATSGDITLTYWGLWEDKNVFQPVIDDYKKSHPTVTIDYVKQDPKQYRERLQASIDRGEGPDIYRFHNTWVPMMINYLAAVPESIYTADEFAKVFYPIATSDLKVGGNIYGIPLEIDGLVLFYNEEMLKAANVSVPTTWLDVQKAVEPNKLTVIANGRIVTSGIALGTAENVEHFSDILGLMFMQNGAQPTKTLTGCADVKDCTSQVFTFYRQFAENPNKTWDDTLDNSILSFAGRKVAMILAPSWQAFTIKTINPSFNFKVTQVPQLPCVKQPCTPVNWATYWVEGVNSKSKNQAAAWEFLKYLSDPATMKKLYGLEQQSRTLFGEPYSRVELGQSLSSNPYIGPVIVEASTMKSFYSASSTFDGETGINSGVNKYLRDAVNSLSQGVSVDAALKTADNGFQQVFTRFGLVTAQ